VTRPLEWLLQNALPAFLGVAVAALLLLRKAVWT
jgi:hypothetical protein